MVRAASRTLVQNENPAFRRNFADPTVGGYFRIATYKFILAQRRHLSRAARYRSNVRSGPSGSCTRGIQVAIRTPSSVGPGQSQYSTKQNPRRVEFGFWLSPKVSADVKLGSGRGSRIDYSRTNGFVRSVGVFCNPRVTNAQACVSFEALAKEEASFAGSVMVTER